VVYERRVGRFRPRRPGWAGSGTPPKGGHHPLVILGRLGCPCPTSRVQGLSPRQGQPASEPQRPQAAA
jgi:hypothetical protein